MIFMPAFAALKTLFKSSSIRGIPPFNTVTFLVSLIALVQVDGKDQSTTKETMIFKRQRLNKFPKERSAKFGESCALANSEINRPAAFSRLAELFTSLANQEG